MNKIKILLSFVSVFLVLTLAYAYATSRNSDTGSLALLSVITAVIVIVTLIIYLIPQQKLATTKNINNTSKVVNKKQPYVYTLPRAVIAFLIYVVLAYLTYLRITTGTGNDYFLPFILSIFLMAFGTLALLMLIKIIFLATKQK